MAFPLVRFVPWGEEVGELVAGETVHIIHEEVREESVSKRQKLASMSKEDGRGEQIGFATAGSKKAVVPSEAALKRAESLFSDTEPPAVVGFITAGSKKAIVPSEAALKRAESLFSDTKPRAVVGFTTAGSKKAVVPSEAALKRAESLFSDTEPPAVVGFTTAGSKKAVVPSEAALKRAESLFSDTEAPSEPALKLAEPFFPLDAPEAATVASTVGFVTAGSKKFVEPSESAMKRADALFAALPESTLEDKVESQKAAIPSDTFAKKQVTSILNTANRRSSHVVSRSSTKKDAAQRRLSFQGTHRIPPVVNSALKENTAPFKRMVPQQAAQQRMKSQQRSTAFKPLTVIKSVPRKIASRSSVAPATAPRVIVATPTTSQRRQSRLPLMADPRCPGADINAENAERVVFDGSGRALLVNAENSHRGYVVALERLCEMRPGLIGGIIPNKITALAWTKNHFKWEVWKAAAIERRFCLGLALDGVNPESPLQFERIVRRLEMRLDKELVLARKPALKAIIQHDASSRRLIVLCVSRVIGFEALELTDGWYAVSAKLDEALTYRVSSGAIAVGTKLCICGARLEGGPIDPIEALLPNSAAADEALFLRLRGNGVRRARADAKLGFQRLLTMCLPLGSIVARQGPVPAVEAVVARVLFPPLSDDDANKKDQEDESEESTKRSDRPPQIQINLLAATGSSKTHTISPPVTAVLNVPVERWLSDGDDAVREGDLIRLYDCEPVATRRDGRLCLRFGSSSRLQRRSSPSDRSLAAHCWFRPRRLLGAAEALFLSRAMSNQSQTDALARIVDLFGLVLGITENALYLGDASPYIIQISWIQATEHSELRRVRAIRPGEVIAFFNLELGHVITSDLLECQLTKDSRLCPTLNRLDDLAAASTSRTFFFNIHFMFTSGLRDDFNGLQIWSKTRIGTSIFSAAIDHMNEILSRRHYQSNLKTPAQQAKMPPTATPIASAIAAFLSGPSATDGATLEDIRSALVNTAPLQTIDDAVQRLQSEYTIFLDNDHRFRIL